MSLDTPDLKTTMVLPDRLSALNPADRAAFATACRLFSCIVTESLVRALYIDLPPAGFEACGVAVILSGDKSAQPPPAIDSPYEQKDILAVLPLRHIPVFKHDGTDPRGPEIGLLDPMDMIPIVFQLKVPEYLDQAPHTEHKDLSLAVLTRLGINGWKLSPTLRLVETKDPVGVWNRLARSIDIDEKMIDDIAEEFKSAIKWQEHSFTHPPKAPQFSSPSIDWEQSIVEGHPTHPMHKSRMFLPPMQDFQPGGYDLYHSRIRLVSLPRDSLNITYNFEELTTPVRKAAAENAKRELCVPPDHVVVPVHELQVAQIQAKFKEAHIYPEEFNVPLLAQQSIRSVILPGVYENLHLKLGVGLKLTSAVRTISPASAYLGPRFSAKVVPHVTMDHSILTVAKELASVVHNNPDGEIAKHCACIVREAHELGSEERGERLIVCTSLVESGHAGKDGDLPAVIRVFELDTEEKRVDWLDKFVDVFFRAFLPSVLKNGVAFEAHPQNCVARFDLQTKEIKGFIIRDFGGIRVHPETLKATTGIELDAAEGHSIIAPDLDDVYARMYHTVIHNHLQQLIRILGLHYNGKGWAVVRKHLKAQIPSDHSLYESWMSPERKTFPGKCFMRMRMQGMYRFHLHGPFPNLIHYEGVAVSR